jgi:hypothetical protein
MRIKNYLDDNTISLDDKLIGTDHEDSDSTKNYSVGDLQLAIRGYKVYTALLTQVGINPPTATVLENTIGNITFSYNSIGNYNINSSGLFTLNKTTVFTGMNVENDLGIIGFAHNTINTIPIVTVNVNLLNTSQNGLLYNSPIEIRVYA